METQTQTTNNPATAIPATPPVDPMGELISALVSTFFDRINAMVDKRVERIMATQATAALFDDALEAKIRTIASEEAQEKIDDMPDMEDMVHDQVADAMQNIDLDDTVERAFKHSINWEEAVEEHVDSLLDDKLDDAVDSALDNVLADKIDELLEERMREALIKIIKGE